MKMQTRSAAIRAPTTRPAMAAPAVAPAFVLVTFITAGLDGAEEEVAGVVYDVEDTLAVESEKLLVDGVGDTFVVDAGVVVFEVVEVLFPPPGVSTMILVVDVVCESCWGIVVVKSTY